MIAHICDAALLEDLMFNIRFFENRSMKHASVPALAKRMAPPSQKHQWTASPDFGAFDRSLERTCERRRQTCAAELGGPSSSCLPIHG